MALQPVHEAGQEPSARHEAERGQRGAEHQRLASGAQLPMGRLHCSEQREGLEASCSHPSLVASAVTLCFQARAELPKQLLVGGLTGLRTAGLGGVT